MAPFDAGDIHIKAGIGRRDMQNRRRFWVLEERLGQTPQGRQGRHQPRLGDDAGVDGHEPPGSPGLEAQQYLPALPLGVQGHAPSRPRGGGEEAGDVGLDANPGQRQANLLVLPGQIGLRRPVLQGAAAAVAKVRAGRPDALGARLNHFKEFGANTLAANQDPFAWKRQGHERSVRRNAVALGAHGVDELE